MNTFQAVEYLCLNIREMDRLEIFGLRNHDSALLLAQEVIHASTRGKAKVFEHQGRPAGIVGVSPMWAGVWTAYSFGTEDWRSVARPMTKYALRVLKPFIEQRGAHRLQCESRVDHTDAHRWLTMLGAEPDGLLRSYGRDGSDYIMFSWVKDHVLQSKDA